MKRTVPTKVNDQAKPDDIKKMILEAAGELYEKKGLHNTSVGEIAERAGISVPVTYHYLSRKSDVMLLIMEMFTRIFKDRVRPELEALDDPKEKLRRAMEVYFSIVHEEMVKVILVYRESRTLDKEGRKKIMAAETEHVSVFEEILREGIDQGVFRNMDVNLAAYNIVMAGHTWALKHWHYKKRFDLDEYLRRQTDFYLNTFLKAPAAKPSSTS